MMKASYMQELKKDKLRFTEETESEKGRARQASEQQKVHDAHQARMAKISQMADERAHMAMLS